MIGHEYCQNAKTHVRLLAVDTQAQGDLIPRSPIPLLLPRSSISAILSASPARGVVVDRAADRPDPKSKLRR